MRPLAPTEAIMNASGQWFTTQLALQTDDPTPIGKSKTRTRELTKRARTDRKRRSGLAALPFMVLDRPSSITDAPTEDCTSIQNLQCIGSYNWVDSADPTIIVPGSHAFCASHPTAE